VRGSKQARDDETWGLIAVAGVGLLGLAYHLDRLIEAKRDVTEMRRSQPF
jgi:hypothetical protein